MTIYVATCVKIGMEIGQKVSMTQEGYALLKTRWIVLMLGASLLAASPTAAIAQKKGTGEVRLVGIKLYDTGSRVVSVYGSPDAIEPINIGGGVSGPSGGGVGPAGRGAGPGPGGPGGAGPAARPGGGGGSASGSADWTDPSGFGDTLLQQSLRGPAPKGGARMGGGAGAPNSGGNQAGPAGPGGGGNNATSSGTVQFTRWVYHRNNSRYGFVMDRYNHVVQIEAIGLRNSRVRTARGITFGSNFAQIIKKYGAPEGYEISGDTVVMRYLVKNKVAFRLARVGENKPQVVTGIAVAAGKA